MNNVYFNLNKSFFNKKGGGDKKLIEKNSEKLFKYYINQEWGKIENYLISLYLMDITLYMKVLDKYSERRERYDVIKNIKKNKK